MRRIAQLPTHIQIPNTPTHTHSHTHPQSLTHTHPHRTSALRSRNLVTPVTRTRRRSGRVLRAAFSHWKISTARESGSRGAYVAWQTGPGAASSPPLTLRTATATRARNHRYPRLVCRKRMSRLQLQALGRPRNHPRLKVKTHMHKRVRVHPRACMYTCTRKAHTREHMRARKALPRSTHTKGRMHARARAHT